MFRFTVNHVSFHGDSVSRFTVKRVSFHGVLNGLLPMVKSYENKRELPALVEWCGSGQKKVVDVTKWRALE